MTEDLETLFDITGTELEFPEGTVMGLPNYLPETLYNGDYKVEQQDFRFIVKTKDVVDFNIKTGDEFSFSDPGYTYTFRVENKPLNDLSGVSELICVYLSKEAL